MHSKFGRRLDSGPISRWKDIPTYQLEGLTLPTRKEMEEKERRGSSVRPRKMDSVGRLAGGIAHDFNNMLTVILGYTALALDRVGPAEPLHADLEEIQMAAQRSADLTRQLLPFARKQTVAPKVLDLNNTIADMLKMLQRLIGEDIDLVWKTR